MATSRMGGRMARLGKIGAMVRVLRDVVAEEEE